MTRHNSRRPDATQTTRQQSSKTAKHGASKPFRPAPEALPPESANAATSTCAAPATPSPADELPRDALAALKYAAGRLDLSLDDGAFDRLLRYLSLLQRWNATYNLTAVRDPQAMLSQHLIDCLAVVGPIHRHLEATRVATGPAHPDTGLRILDVGSGGGLPGVVLAIADPRLDVTCVDTVGKKAAFIRQAAGHLGLPRLHAAHARVESLAIEVRQDGFNVITSRAFSSLADFTRLTAGLLAPGGVWMAMKGRVPDDEIAALPSDIDLFHVEHLSIPGLGAERCLVWMRPRTHPASAPSHEDEPPPPSGGLESH